MTIGATSATASLRCGGASNVRENAVWNPLGAITQSTAREAAEFSGTQPLAVAMMREVIAVAAAVGMPLDANAEALVASLILENYKAYSRPVQAGSQAMLAVYVGPVLTQAEATSLQQQLKTSQQLKDAIVVPFIIDAPVQRQ